MRKGRGRSARLVTVFLALLVALVLTGMGYGIWSDTLNISSIVKTGIIDTVIFYDYAQSIPPSAGTIYGIPTGMTLDVHAVNVQDSTDYYCHFSIVNKVTGLPVKIQSITIKPAVADWPTYPPDGFNGSVTIDGKTPDMVIGDVIDPGETKAGIVHVYLDGAPVGSYFHVLIEVDVVIWNQ